MEFNGQIWGSGTGGAGLDSFALSLLTFQKTAPIYGRAGHCFCHFSAIFPAFFLAFFMGWKAYRGDVKAQRAGLGGHLSFLWQAALLPIT